MEYPHQDDPLFGHPFSWLIVWCLRHNMAMQIMVPTFGSTQYNFLTEEGKSYEGWIQTKPGRDVCRDARNSSKTPLRLARVRSWRQTPLVNFRENGREQFQAEADSVCSLVLLWKSVKVAWLTPRESTQPLPDFNEPSTEQGNCQVSLSVFSLSFPHEARFREKGLKRGRVSGGGWTEERPSIREICASAISSIFFNPFIHTTKQHCLLVLKKSSY